MRSLESTRVTQTRECKRTPKAVLICHRLLRGTDYEGNVCGSDTKKDLPLTYYPKVTEDLLLFASSGETNPLKIKLFGLCVKSCPTIGSVVCTTEGDTALNALTGGDATKRFETRATCDTVSGVLSNPSCLKVKAGCWSVPLASTTGELIGTRIAKASVTLCSVAPLLLGAQEEFHVRVHLYRATRPCRPAFLQHDCSGAVSVRCEASSTSLPYTGTLKLPGSLDRHNYHPR